MVKVRDGQVANRPVYAAIVTATITFCSSISGVEMSNVGPDYSVLPPSSTFVPDGNDERYGTWSALLDASDEWAEAESTFTHPEYVDAAFLL